MTLLELVAAADRIGIAAFAISGVAVGFRARMDIFGLIALGLVTAVGGGVIRDVVIGDVPRVFIADDYLVIAVVSSLVAIGAGAAGWKAPDAVMKAADAIGTGAFATAGALIAWDANLNWAAAVILAVLTATGGGVLRDVLASNVPRVLHSEMNATGAVAGGALTYVLAEQAIDVAWATAAGALLAAAVAAFGHTGLLRLPRVRSSDESDE